MQMFGSTGTAMVMTSKADVSSCRLPVFNARANRLQVDYNSWVESNKGRRLAASLSKDVVLAEGTFPISVTLLGRRN